jgi:hypothetical protein
MGRPSFLPAPTQPPPPRPRCSFPDLGELLRSRGKALDFSIGGEVAACERLGGKTHPIPAHAPTRPYTHAHPPDGMQLARSAQPGVETEAPSKMPLLKKKKFSPLPDYIFQQYDCRDLGSWGS